MNLYFLKYFLSCLAINQWKLSIHVGLDFQNFTSSITYDKTKDRLE